MVQEVRKDIKKTFQTDYGNLENNPESMTDGNYYIEVQILRTKNDWDKSSNASLIFRNRHLS